MGERSSKLIGVALACLFPVAFAAGVDSELVDNASALIAVQLSSEIGEGLSSELVEKGMEKNDADALVFRVVDGAARCTVRRLKDHELPQVVSFVDLLARNEEMTSVTGALNEMYEPEELDAMQFEIARAARECLQKSMRIPQKMSDKPVAKAAERNSSGRAA